MLGITSFSVSAILLVGLLGLRYIEMQRGSRFLPRFRKTLDYIALLFVRYVVKEFPRYIIRGIQYIGLQITHFFSLILLKLVRLFESRLRVVVYKVRGKKENLVKGEPTSSYFQDVKNHKEEVSKTIEELEEVQ